jgi:hypothetical protein
MSINTVVYDTDATGFRSATSADVISSTGLSYEHTQATPATAWVVQHNLNTLFLDIRTFRSTGEEMFGDPNWAGATVNQITINFSNALAGVAKVRPL